MSVEIPIARTSSTSENPLFESKWIDFCPLNFRLPQNRDEIKMCGLKFKLFLYPPLCLRLSKFHPLVNQIHMDSAFCIFY